MRNLRVYLNKRHFELSLLMEGLYKNITVQAWNHNSEDCYWLCCVASFWPGGSDDYHLFTYVDFVLNRRTYKSIHVSSSFLFCHVSTADLKAFFWNFVRSANTKWYTRMEWSSLSNCFWNTISDPSLIENLFFLTKKSIRLDFAINRQHF